MSDEGLERLLDYIRETRGFDFTGYKRTSLARRMRKRVDARGCPDFNTYMDVLAEDPGEFSELFNTVLINVTSFFRDPEAWQLVGRELIPKMLETHDDDDAIPVDSRLRDR